MATFWLTASILASAVVSASLKPPPKGDLWAVLVAGSNSWFNYRHQADVCHAYHVLHNHGIPDERIIVMMYDDIAHNDQNPTPGVVINHINGSDVYHGVPLDYTKDLVTPKNFVKILTGQSVAGGSGKMLKSGPNDHVFINFADHGAPGILAFPSGELTVQQLTKAISVMNSKKMYKKMVFYVEACESGSMFQGQLPSNINVYATTAADPHESSYACYYDDARDTYLGDVYSVNWMEDSDKENLEDETLLNQFETVRGETNTSHVMEYGDLSMDDDVVGEFQGEKATPKITYPKTKYDAVPSPDVPLILKYRQLEKTTDKVKRSALQKELKMMTTGRKFVKQLFDRIALEATRDKIRARKVVEAKRSLVDTDCHHNVVKHFSQHCLSFSKNSYVMRFVQVLVNMCEEKIPVKNIKNAVDAACKALPNSLEPIV
jgi:legumain